MAQATIYTKPGCSDCDKSKALMDELGVTYHSVDITVDKTAIVKLKALGYRAMPVVITEDAKWSGFNESAIRDLATGESAWEF